jgi:hypothetical protein
MNRELAHGVVRQVQDQVDPEVIRRGNLGHTHKQGIPPSIESLATDGL